MRLPSNQQQQRIYKQKRGSLNNSYAGTRIDHGLHGDDRIEHHQPRRWRLRAEGAVVAAELLEVEEEVELLVEAARPLILVLVHAGHRVAEVRYELAVRGHLAQLLHEEVAAELAALRVVGCECKRVCEAGGE